jgi:hypothetical protein
MRRSFAISSIFALLAFASATLDPVPQATAGSLRTGQEQAAQIDYYLDTLSAPLR